MGGSDTDVSQAITVDASGNVISTGHFFGTADFDPGPGISNLTAQGASDIYVQKLDPSGDFLFVKSMRGSWLNEGKSVAVDDEGNIYTAGIFSETTDFDPSAGTRNLVSAGDLDAYIQKLDPSGNLLWVNSIGGNSTDWAYTLDVDLNGDVFVAGGFRAIADFDPGSDSLNIPSISGEDIFVLKLGGGNNVGIENIFFSEIKVYPNPNQGIFTIDIPVAYSSAQVSIQDIRGKLFYERLLFDRKNKLDLSHLPHQLYLMKITLVTGEEFFAKLILE